MAVQAKTDRPRRGGMRRISCGQSPLARARHCRPERCGLAADPPRGRPRSAEKAAPGPWGGPKPGRRPLRPLYLLRGARPVVRGALGGPGALSCRVRTGAALPGAAGRRRAQPDLPNAPGEAPGDPRRALGAAREPRGKPPAGAASNRGIPGDFEGPVANPRMAPLATPEDPVRVPPAKAVCGRNGRGAAPASGGPGPSFASTLSLGLSPAPRDADPARERGRRDPVRGVWHAGPTGGPSVPPLTV